MTGAISESEVTSDNIYYVFYMSVDRRLLCVLRLVLCCTWCRKTYTGSSAVIYLPDIICCI